MRTNLQKTNIGTAVPAGIMSGIEAFWFDGKKMVIANGVTYEFNESPSQVRNIIKEAFLSDKRSHKLMKQHGITGLNECFDKWYHCVIGALDEAPDFVDGNLNADAYNHMCKDYKCAMRGKLCSLSLGLKNYEISTLKLLQEGITVKEAAERACMSFAGMKSRIEHLKLKLGAKNLAQLVAIATSIGI